MVTHAVPLGRERGPPTGWPFFVVSSLPTVTSSVRPGPLATITAGIAVGGGTGCRELSHTAIRNSCRSESVISGADWQMRTKALDREVISSSSSFLIVMLGVDRVISSVARTWASMNTSRLAEYSSACAAVRLHL